jgi:hypothetical protein
MSAPERNYKLKKSQLFEFPYICLGNLKTVEIRKSLFYFKY